MLNLAIAILIMLMGSALCSCSEAALLSVPLLKARQLAESKRPAAVALLAIRQKINRPIATIVILNNLFNIVGSVLIGGIAANLFKDALLGVFTGLLTLLVILFGEIFPKIFGERYALPIALTLVVPVQWLTWLFTPIVLLLENITAPLTSQGKGPSTNEAEIKLMATIGHQEGIIEADEAEMIRRVFRLNDMKSIDIMTPRVAVTHLPGDLTIAAAQEQILKSQHSRILVSDNDIDRIVGLVLKNDLLTALIRGQGDQLLSQIARPVRFVAEAERADKLLQDFQTVREHLAVVVDEYGGVSGVVTLEDVLEVLTGEIVDETDRSIDLQKLARQRGRQILRTRGFNWPAER
ncbi:HlyC/CorC family transporter [Nodosilinea sp. LEGE 07088]|uniref:hemolysin family protein n=1 Tax=Nodosilinea sp. LEGE 07088 TaxID=2777968 RepID=UPI001882B23C|nr:hemolysin family protein [Nodosilinea sp. LEGE 07088]MBE9138055.1 HlyC/CorC family transporter [Nodosilinea sp. LEGE 07088]